MSDNRVTLSWSMDDAQEVADIFLRAATRGAKVVDRGFYDDYHEIMRQIEAIESKENDAPRVRLVVMER